MVKLIRREKIVALLVGNPIPGKEYQVMNLLKKNGLIKNGKQRKYKEEIMKGRGSKVNLMFSKMPMRK